MAQETLVNEQIEDGRLFLDRLAREGIDVTAAGWVKESLRGRWYLYLATPLAKGGATRNAYGRILPVIRQMPQPFGIDVFEVKAVDPSVPLAEALVTLRASHPRRPIHRFDGKHFGHVGVEEMYVYATPALTTVT
jgi:hypothetical protein